ncbi:hypothetical protein DFJ74DRAFT_643980 [Hyaloraphidium curvatum]|nr:hypothetical protein DFJ74DRAFT_643980 [Hyaloraphidium curvatum]
MGPNRQHKKDSKKGGKNASRKSNRGGGRAAKPDRDARGGKGGRRGKDASAVLSAKSAKRDRRLQGPVPFLGMSKEQMKTLRGLLLEYSEARREVETIREEDEKSLSGDSTDESGDESGEDAGPGPSAGPARGGAPKPPLAQPRPQKQARVDLDSNPSESEYDEEGDSDYDDEDEESGDSEEGSTSDASDDDDDSEEGASDESWSALYDKHGGKPYDSDDSSSEPDFSESDLEAELPPRRPAADSPPIPYETSSHPAFRVLAAAGVAGRTAQRILEDASLPSTAHSKARREAGSILWRALARAHPDEDAWNGNAEARLEQGEVLGAMFPESFEQTQFLVDLDKALYRSMGIEPREGEATEGGELWSVSFGVEVPEGALQRGSGGGNAAGGKGKEKPVCVFFQKGKCTKGANCSFLHPAPASGPSVTPGLPTAFIRFLFPEHHPPTLLLTFPSLDLLPAQLEGANRGARAAFARGGPWEAVEWVRERGGAVLLESIPPPQPAPARAVPKTLRIGGMASKYPVPASARAQEGMVTTSRDIVEGRTLVEILEKPYDGPPVAGTVAEVLTRGDHPYGVKVRLDDGRVGRVRSILGENTGRASWKQGRDDKSKSVDRAGEKAVADVVERLGKLGTAGDGVRKALGTVAGRPFPTKVKLAIREDAELSSSPSFAAPVAQPASPATPRLPAGGPKPDSAESSRLLEGFKRLQQNPRYQTMQEARRKLPAWAKRDEIVAAVEANRVTVVEGETGCGKSTQVPQYLLDHAVLAGKGAETKILVTQPRRISAIGVADRVAKERAGEVGGEVGYQIRLEAKLSQATKVMFVTAGILLRRLEGGGDEGISDISHIILDEVHERSLESDFLLLVLRQLLPLRPDLKVVLMSATLNAELFQAYFGEGTPRLLIPGRTFPVQPIFLEDALKMTGYFPEGDLAKRQLRQKAPRDPYKNVEELPDGDLSVEELGARYPTLSKEQLRSLSQLDEEKIQYPLVEMLVVRMVGELLPAFAKGNVPVVGAAPGQGQGSRGGRGRGNGRPDTPSGGRGSPAPGAADPGSTSSPNDAPNRGILIFLPGYAEISAMHELLSANSVIRAATANGRLLLPLHGVLSSEEQIRVFDRPPEGSCKIVIATNVAETSITIDDVVYVVDSGKMKETRFEPSKGMSSLEECWVSRANALQRRGRAGRVQPGTCYHLFTSHRFENVLLPQQIPEIRRTPLDQICLRIKTLTFLRGRIDAILANIIEPPAAEAVLAAVTTLRTLQALTKDEQLTPLGFHLGHLPVDVRIGKLILYGAIFGCLDPVLTIAAALSVKSPFVAPFDKRELADERKREFAMAASDHLTVLNAYRQWYLQRRGGMAQERRWLFDNFLSGRTLSMLASVKRQLVELLSDIGFVKEGLKARDMERRGGFTSDGVAEALGDSAGADRADNMELVKGTLIAALYPNVIKIDAPSAGSGKVKGKKGTPAPSGEAKLLVRGVDAEQVFLHPTSVNYRVKEFPHPFLVYLEKVRTTKVYVRDSSCVSPYAMAFFGGRLTWDARQGVLNMDDGWIRFKPSSPAVALILEATRTAFNELLAMKIADPGLDVSKVRLINAIVDLVSGAGLGKHHYRARLVETQERPQRPPSELSGMWDGPGPGGRGATSSPRPGNERPGSRASPGPSNTGGTGTGGSQRPASAGAGGFRGGRGGNGASGSNRGGRPSTESSASDRGGRGRGASRGRR